MQPQLHPSGLFTYARVEERPGERRYHDCHLVVSVPYDYLVERAALRDTIHPVTFHQDEACAAGASLGLIVETPTQLLGWRGDSNEVVLDGPRPGAAAVPLTQSLVQ